MSRKRTGRRNTTALNARLDLELDADLISWLESQPSGRRSEAIRSMMRSGLRIDYLRGEMEAIIRAAISEALAALDSYDHVTRVSTFMLREYEPGAYLRGPIVQGINVYLIDTTGDILYREDLNETGSELVNRDPQIITRRGEVIDEQVIGGLIDLTWMIEGGTPQRNVLGVLSRDNSGYGILITYSPSWDVAAQPLPSSQAWIDPRAIAVYERALYILDAGANEIWRYEAGASSYKDRKSE